MTVLNIMLGKKRGGIEQAAIDYAWALQQAGFNALTVVSPQSWAAEELARRNLPFVTLSQWGGWDPFAARTLRRYSRHHRANVMLCHGNRALSLALAARASAKVVAIAHNYKTRRFARADVCFAITRHAAQSLEQNGIEPARIHFMPNGAEAGPWRPRAAFHTPPVIGSMGRFVAKKGFDLYLDALGLLAQRGVAFTAILGGSGEEEEALRARRDALGLAEKVAMTGWVADKQAFFDGIDLFVLPSHHEPFGIVMAEAMAACLPFIATASEGPSEVIRHGENGLLTPLGDAPALADAMARLLANEPLARQLGEAAHATIAADYSMEALSARLRDTLSRIA